MIYMITKTEVFSRVCGYLRPISFWNEAKLAEFFDRRMFTIDTTGTPSIE